MCLVVYGCMLAISLYRVIRRIKTIALHLGVMNGRGDMVDRACDYVCGTMMKIRCSGSLGGDICARLCVYAFRYSDCVV